MIGGIRHYAAIVAVQAHARSAALPAVSTAAVQAVLDQRVREGGRFGFEPNECRATYDAAMAWVAPPSRPQATLDDWGLPEDNYCGGY